MTVLFREEYQSNGITKRINIYTFRPNMFSLWLWEPKDGEQIMTSGDPIIYLFKDKDISKLYEFVKTSNSGKKFKLQYNQFYRHSTDMDCTKFFVSDLGKKFKIDIVTEHREYFGLKLEYSDSRSYEITKETLMELSKDLNDLYSQSNPDRKKS